MKKITRIISIVLIVSVMAASLVLCAACDGEKQPIKADNSLSVFDANGKDVSNMASEMTSRLVFASIRPFEPAVVSDAAAASLGEPIGTTTLTVSYTPENTTNKKINWSVSFVNAASEWATGKNAQDYVKVEYESDNTNRNPVTVNCYAAFGEQIVITAASADNPSVTATCTLDFVKRLQGFTLNNGAITTGSTIAFNTDYTWTLTPQLSDGTITGTFSQLSGLSLKLNPETLSTCQAAVTSGNYNFTDEIMLSSDFAVGAWTQAINLGECTRFLTAQGNPGNGREQWQSAMYNYLYSCWQAPQKVSATLRFSCDYSFSGIGANSYNLVIPVMLDHNSVKVNISNITLDHDSLTY